MPATPDAPAVPEPPLSEPAVTAPARRPRAARASTAPDAVCAAAVDLARAAAAEMAGEANVGEHEGVTGEGERVVTHAFTALLPGYRGWRWAVTVARASRARVATVSEVVLLPGAEALLPPAWVPWSDRVAPGDLGPADQLPYRADDPHLEAGYAPAGREALEGAVDSVESIELPPVADVVAAGEIAPLLPADDEADRLAVFELGLGRRRVLSAEGREAAATRWYTGEHGPMSDAAQHAAAPCASCGFYLPLSGALRQLFGVCANAWSPDDGKVVSLDHGCGAHSETDVEHPEAETLPSLILDETGAEAVVVPPRPEAVVEDVVIDEAGADQALAEDAVTETAVEDVVPTAEEAPAPVVEDPTPPDVAVEAVDTGEAEAVAPTESSEAAEPDPQP